MSEVFRLTGAQMARLEPFLPKSNVKPRVDDRHDLPQSPPHSDRFGLQNMEEVA